MCLKYLPHVVEQPNSRFNDSNVPWQRVINSKGEISNRHVSHSMKVTTLLTRVSGADGAARQEAALTQEQVVVGRGNLGERTVDFETYGWFPEELPSRQG